MSLSQDVKRHTYRRQFFITPNTAVDTLPCSLNISDPETVHHAKNVLRLKAGEELLAVDPGLQTAYQARIDDVDRQTIFITLHKKAPQVADPIPSIVLGCGIIKEQRWDWLLQKTTELGVQSITPLLTQHTVVKIDEPEKKLLRWQQIVRNAAEQSEGLFIPTLYLPASVSAFCQIFQQSELRLFLDERPHPERCSLQEILAQHKSAPPASIVAALGPEGGWTKEERESLLSHGFQSVSLGTRVLRSETAASTIMSILRYEFGN